MSGPFVDIHLSALKKSISEPSQNFVGHDVRKFAGWLIGEGLNNCLPQVLDPGRLPEGNTNTGPKHGRLSRTDLFDFIEGKANNLECAVAVLAWGGMNRRYAFDALSNWGAWSEAVELVRSGRIDRRRAYEMFAELRHVKRDGKPEVRGMGPAYFTKLIFYMRPAHDGYIMDQWTAKSMVLLTGNPDLIGFRNGGTVADKNTADTYERFCGLIDQLADELSLKNGQKAEELIFSHGGRQKGYWRCYLSRMLDGLPCRCPTKHTD